MDGSKMQLIYRDKVVRRSGNCLAAKLPALVCKTLGITAGSDVHCYLMDGDLVLRFPGRVVGDEEIKEVF